MAIAGGRFYVSLWDILEIFLIVSCMTLPRLWPEFQVAAACHLVELHLLQLSLFSYHEQMGRWLTTGIALAGDTAACFFLFSCWNGAVCSNMDVYADRLLLDVAKAVTLSGLLLVTLLGRVSQLFSELDAAMEHRLRALQSQRVDTVYSWTAATASRKLAAPMYATARSYH